MNKTDFFLVEQCHYARNAESDFTAIIILTLTMLS